MRQPYPSRRISRIWFLGAVAAVVAASLSVSGCGPSYEEKEAQRRAAQELAHAERDRARQERLGQVGARFNAIGFPGTELSENVYTIELQRALRRHQGRPFVLEAFVEDIEETPRGSVVEFTRPLGDSLIGDRSALVFRVEARAEHVDKILAAPRPDILSRTLRFLREADCIIVVKINSVRSARPFKTADWPSEKGDTGIVSKDSPRFVAEGELLDVVLLEKQPRPKQEAR